MYCCIFAENYKTKKKYSAMKQSNKKNIYFCSSKKGETMIPEKYVRFDWAAKNLLRDKANFGVLEGLITVLLNEEIKIEEILESEANREYDIDKFNRVDIKAKNSKDEIIIVEVQQSSETDFLKRILYSVSKNIAENIALGDEYQNVKKIYSINILYFNFGIGTDYIYHGQTTFTGVNTHDTLKISLKQQNALSIKTPEEIFPEYYIIRVNEFDKEAATPLEEWLDYLKNGRIKDDTTTPGLVEAREKLLYMMMNRTDQLRYFRHVDLMKSARDSARTYRMEGLWEGRAEGLKEGLEKGEAKGKAEGLAEGEAKGKAEGLAEGEAKAKLAMAKSLLEQGVNIDIITKTTGLSESELKTEI